MKVRAGVALAVLLGSFIAVSQAANARSGKGPVKLVAAENFYGGIAHQIGGLLVEVTSILNNPEQDPHLFETSPTVARQLADAQIVIVNGADYDPWASKLLRVAPRPGRTVVDVARLTGWRPGGNPHLWYDPATMPAVARALAVALSKADPDHADDYAQGLKATLASLVHVRARVYHMRAKYFGQPVTATEPVFGLMAAALGLRMRNESFQTAIMNGTEPSARDLAAFENDLKEHRVKALIHNRQVSEKLTERLIAIAENAKVPVVAVTETQPAGTSFADWMLAQLDALDKALAGRDS
jgi:zinc/manganese transport system substrate-binding protein